MKSGPVGRDRGGGPPLVFLSVAGRFAPKNDVFGGSPQGRLRDPLKRVPREPQEGPKSAQEAPGEPQESPNLALDGPKTALDDPQEGPKAALCFLFPKQR